VTDYVQPLIPAGCRPLSLHGSPPAGVGFWRRGVARGIDLAVHCLVTVGALFAGVFLVALAFAVRGRSPDAAVERLSALSWEITLIPGLGATAMHALAEGLHGSTIGKRLCGIAVIDQDGGPCQLVSAIKRSVAWHLDALILGLVAAQSMSESRRRQRIGDKWGRTMVVQIRYLAPVARRSKMRFVAVTAAALALDGAIYFGWLVARML
jgi:uncharacterized RDD family membrane protein YckC